MSELSGIFGEWNGIRCDLLELVKATDVYRRVLDKSKIPPLHFKTEWDVRIIPPFGGAMMRFTVDHNGKHVSVYCDFFQNLGCFRGPYWEMYPRSYKWNGEPYTDVMRFALNDTESLIANIDAELRGEEAK